MPIDHCFNFHASCRVNLSSHFDHVSRLGPNKFIELFDHVFLVQAHIFRKIKQINLTKEKIFGKLTTKWTPVYLPKKFSGKLTVKWAPAIYFKIFFGICSAKSTSTTILSKNFIALHYPHDHDLKCKENVAKQAQDRAKRVFAHKTSITQEKERKTLT